MTVGRTGLSLLRMSLLLLPGIASTCWADDSQTTAAITDSTAATAYSDRILSSDKLAVFAENITPYDDSGLPRNLNIEWLSNYNKLSGQSGSGYRPDYRLDHGLAVQRYWQTANLGEFSLGAVGFYNDQPDTLNDQQWQGRFTLWQRQFYINNRWRSDNGLGVLTTPVPHLLRETSRIFLPTISLLGISSELQKKGGLDEQRIQLAIGQAGQLNGRQVAGFEADNGQVYAVNAEQAFKSGWHSAFALIQNEQSSLSGNSYSSGNPIQPYRSALAALGWQQQSESIQLNVLSTESEHRQSSGVWMDGRYRKYNTEHQYGLYYLQPELNWGGQAMQQDAQGGYYRFNHEKTRWLWSGGIDYLNSLSRQRFGKGSDSSFGGGFDGVYANSFARYQANTKTGYGGGITLRYSDADKAYGQQLFIEQQHRYGQTRTQLDYAQAPEQHFDSMQLSVDHALTLAQDKRLSVSASYQQLKQAQTKDQIMSLTTYGGVALGNNMSLDGSARWSRSLEQQRHSIGLNLSAKWQVQPDWQLSTTLYQNQNRFEPEIIFDPLQPSQQPIRETQNELSVLFSLRYQKRAGSPREVMAGSARDAVGSIKGSVFLDENRDGIRAASERGAAQVTVMLNNRYSVQTNELGEFEFPMVAVGTQQIQVIADHLPLPWYFADARGTQTVEVNVRQPSRIDIGAIRMR